MNGGFEINRHFFLNICILPIFCSLKEMTGSTSYLLILFLCFQSSLYRRTWRIPQRCSYSENEDPQKAQVFVGRPHRAALIISKPINTGKSLTRLPLPGRGFCFLGHIPKPLVSVQQVYNSSIPQSTRSLYNKVNDVIFIQEA